MSVQYLKKTKMYHLLENIIESEYMPKLSECRYRYYRGSEWLEFYIDLDFIVTLYHSSAYVSLDFDTFDVLDRRNSYDRLTFTFMDNDLSLRYKRREHNQFIKTCISKTA